MNHQQQIEEKKIVRPMHLHYLKSLQWNACRFFFCSEYFANFEAHYVGHNRAMHIMCVRPPEIDIYGKLFRYAN